MDRIQTEWEALAALRRKVRGIYLVHMLVYVLVLVLLAFKVLIPAVVLGVLNMLISLLYVRRRAVAYSNEATRLNLLLGLCAPLEDARCTGKNGMSQADFSALQMLPTGRSKGDGLMCHNSFEGKGFGLTLKGFEATLAYPFKGKNDRPMFRYLNGTILTAEQLPAGHARGDWLLLRRGLLAEDARRSFAESCGYHLVETGDAPEEQFHIYIHGEDAALPTHLRHHLSLLAQGATDAAAIRLAPDRAAVYLEDQFYTVTIPLHYLPEPQQLAANPLPQRDAVWELFRYWAKVN